MKDLHRLIGMYVFINLKITVTLQMTVCHWELMFNWLYTMSPAGQLFSREYECLIQATFFISRCIILLWSHSECVSPDTTCFINWSTLFTLHYWPVPILYCSLISLSCRINFTFSSQSLMIVYSSFSTRGKEQSCQPVRSLFINCSSQKPT